MSKPFSFLSPRPSPVAADQPAGGPAVATPGAGSPSASVATPAPASLWEAPPSQIPGPESGSLFFRPIPYMPPMGASPSSVISSAHVPPSPLESHSPNRAVRGPNEPAPFGLSPALQSQTPPPSPWGKQGTPATPPAQLHPGQISSREVAQLRLEMREEIEQVRNDLFGAATGVSAVKDRLDGLEARMTRLEQAVANSGSARQEEWQALLDQKIQERVQEAVRQALLEQMPALSSRTTS